MISKAKFENFKGLRNVEVMFDSRFTVLVGPNGSGKTSVLEGLHYLCQFPITRDPWKIFSGGYRLDFHYSRPFPRPPDRIDLRIAVNFTDWKTKSAHTFVATATPPHERNEHNPDDGWEIGLSSSEVDLGKPVVRVTDNRSLPREVRDLGSAVYLYLDAGFISAPSYSESSPPRLAPTGDRVPSVLAYIAGKYPELFGGFVTALRRVIPHLRGVRFDRIPVYRKVTQVVELDGARTEQEIPQRVVGDALIYDFANGITIPSTMASEGTLLTTGLLAAIFSPNRPRLLLLDDIDKGLHPKAQSELVGLIRHLLADFPDLQIIATSHSPYILDKLEPNEVRVTGLGDDGATIVAPLTDHPAYEKWKESMTPGEFWSHTGEEWLKKLKRSVPTS